MLALRRRGADNAEILRSASEEGWNVGERQIEAYIQRSDELLAASVEKDRPKRVNLHLAQGQREAPASKFHDSILALL